MNDVQKLLLKIMGAVLFGGEAPEIEAQNIEPLLKESKAQTVFPLVFSAIENQVENAMCSEQYAEYSQLFFTSITAGVCNFAEHGELHKLMTDNDISYVTIKGISSAMYYDSPSLRSAGDVDILVYERDFERTGQLLESIGFVKENDDDGDIHTAYRRPPISIWELHKKVNGIPKNDIGEIISKEIDEVVGKAVLENIDGTSCMVPCKFHHGLIMLLHLVSHLTSEGVGLRHLCDWVVFVSSMNDKEFTTIFESKLKEYGLWKFAQILTLLGVRYLNAPMRNWIDISQSDDVLEALMEDILNGGNFGFKDMNRYREIKYISDREDGTVKHDGIISQGFKTLNRKVYDRFQVVDKYRVLLPIGWVLEILKYFGLLISGKRKSTDTKSMLKEAKKRKKIYSSLELFDVNN